MRRIFVFLTIVLLTSISFSRGARNLMLQPVEVTLETKIKQGPYRTYTGKPVTWKDFKGTPDSTSEFAAMIYSGIGMKYEFRQSGNKTIVEVRLHPYMNREKSWYKDSLITDHLLRHEQGHFDIAAIVAKELAERIRTNHYNVANFKDEIDRLHKEYLHILWERQVSYDEQTQHGMHAEQQIAWHLELSQRLDAYDLMP